MAHIEDPPLRLDIRERELDLPVDTPGTQQRRVQALYPVGRQDDLDIRPRIKPIELVQELEHRPLDLTLPARLRVIPASEEPISETRLKT